MYRGLWVSISLSIATLLSACGGAGSASLGSASASAAASPAAAGSKPAAAPSVASTSAKPAAASAAATSAAASGAAGGQTIKLGVVLPVTGIQAILGTAAKNGLQMAVDEINAAGGVEGKKIEVDLADAGASNTVALNAAIKVVGDKPNVMVISPVSTQNLAMAPTIKQAGVPAFFASSADVLTTLGAPLYRIIVRDGVSLPAASAFIKDDLHKTKIGVIHIDDEYGTGSANLAVASAKKLNMDVVANEAFSADTRDFSPNLLKIKNAGAEALMVYAYPVNVAAIIKQRLQLGLTMPLMGANPIGQASVLKLVSEEEVNGAYGTGTPDPAARSSIPQVQQWLDKFKAKYNTDGDTYAAAYYDAVQLLKQAVVAEKGVIDPESIKKGLLSVKDYQGISSPFTCVASGDCTHVTWTIQDKAKTPTILKVVAEEGFSAPPK